MSMLLNLAEIASALAHVPDTPENRAEVGRLLRSLTPIDDAYDLWTNWLRYGRIGLDAKSEWDALDVDPEGAITVSRLFMYAREAGWDGGYESYGNLGRVPRWCVARERERKLKEFNLRHGLVLLNGVAAVVYRAYGQNESVITTQVADVDSMRVYFANQYVPVIKHYPDGYTLSDKTPLFDEWLRWGNRRTYGRVVVIDKESGDSLELPDSEEIALLRGVVRRLAAPTQTASVLGTNPPLQPLETFHMLQWTRTEVSAPPQDVGMEDFE